MFATRTRKEGTAVSTGTSVTLTERGVRAGQVKYAHFGKSGSLPKACQSADTPRVEIPAAATDW